MALDAERRASCCRNRRFGWTVSRNHARQRVHPLVGDERDITFQGEPHVASQPPCRALQSSGRGITVRGLCGSIVTNRPFTLPVTLPPRAAIARILPSNGAVPPSPPLTWHVPSRE
jgi:hypothetical protein